MTRIIATTLTTLALISGAMTGRAADEEIISSSRTAHMSAEDRGVESCAQAFVARILPDAKVKIRIVNATNNQVFQTSGYALQMDVALTAKLARTGELLATSLCTVDRKARVQHQSVKVYEPAKLAALRPAELRLAQASR